MSCACTSTEAFSETINAPVTKTHTFNLCSTCRSFCCMSSARYLHPLLPLPPPPPRHPPLLMMTMLSADAVGVVLSYV